MVASLVLWHGEAGLGPAGQCSAGHGVERQVWFGAARLRVVRHGWAPPVAAGEAWRGFARPGVAWEGSAR